MSRRLRFAPVVVGLMLVSCSTSDAINADVGYEPVPGHEPPDTADTGEEELDDDGGDDDGSNFAAELDVPPPLEMCDFWAEDPCPPAEKCQAIASTPGSGAWDANVCVPAGHDGVDENCCLAGVGNCPIAGPAGTDSCDETSICLNVDSDTWLGQCVEYCVGPEASASCPQTGGTCQKLSGSPRNICITGCDPLLEGDCPSGQNCVTSFAAGGVLTGFICFAPGTAEPGAHADPCECTNCCQQGHMCDAQAEVGQDCEADFCCTGLCDASNPEATCAGPDQVCVPLFDEADPLYGHIGECRVPEAP